MTEAALAKAFAKKLHSIGACPEGRDFILAGNHEDFRATWRLCPAGEFLAWIATRLLGVEGTRAAVQCARAAAKVANDPSLPPILALCEQVLDGKAGAPGPGLDAALAKLQALAYDATAAALSDPKGNGEARVAAAYAAYAVAFASMAAHAKDAEDKKRMTAKAAQHSSDAAVHAWESMPGKNSGLAHIVRDAIKEDALVRAWAAIPSSR
jgi:hypothetical protein